MDDLLREFLTETGEGLAVLDQDLVSLEKNPDNPALLDSIFRVVHTIKGTCGFLGLPRLERLAHAAENVLGKFRDREVEITADAVTLILDSLDQIKEILAAIEATEAEPEGDDEALIARLDAAAEGKLAEADALPATPQDVGEEASAPAVEADEYGFTPVSAAEMQARVEAEATEPEPEASEPETAESTAAEAPKAEVQVAPEDAPRDGGLASQNIRVSVDLLENLMNMVSELVLTRNQLLQILRHQHESEFAAPLQRLNHVTSELQEGVMKTRMQPIGNAWAKLPRIVRDLALDLDKKIDLRMKGEETELDRQLLELIKDPLTHMVRNSADHGIEDPKTRLAAGKPETGHINLSARHEGGHIIIEIVDDGRGIALDKVKKKVLANGLATEAEIGGMTDQQIQQFIFRAGFSTAAAVTNVSGRGVGMDVVRSNIEKIGGTIELNSVEGRGSTFTIKIPLTLAIVNALIVECGGDRFAVPQISVVELVRTSTKSENAIEWINDAPVLRLRDRLLPLVSLRKLLNVDESERADDNHFIIVTQVGTYTFGIIVDRVFDTEEIVVKPVSPILRDISMFSGNTILGDGSVVMILDPNGIAMATGEVAPAEATAVDDDDAAVDAAETERMTLLVFRAGGDRSQMAVPLSLVARLEEIDCAKIERTNGHPVVQYRGKLMPLATIDGAAPMKEEGQIPVLVFSDGPHSMGLVVEEIVDIVEEAMNVELRGDAPGLLGSAIIDGRATDILDAGHYVGQAMRAWGDAEGKVKGGRSQRVLLVDDSPFFRNLLTPLLRVAGYDVTSVETAENALALCEDGEDFDVIVSDIDMPGMDGYAFAEAVKAQARWHDTPIVAVSHSASPHDLDRGRAAGFADYIAKFDREALLHTLSETVRSTGGAA